MSTVDSFCFVLILLPCLLCSCLVHSYSHLFLGCLFPSAFHNLALSHLYEDIIIDINLSFLPKDFPEDNTSPPTATETVKIVTDLKTFGNTAFKSNNLPLALDKYDKGLRYLNEEPDLTSAPAETSSTLASLRFTLNSNSALLHNRLKNFSDAEKFASAALDVTGVTDADKAKALYRRAIAYVGLKDEDAALKDLEEANKLVPGDAAVLKELAAVKKSAADRAKKEKAAYSKFFS